MSEEPSAWLHTMHYETGETNEEVTLAKWNPWGKPGKDYSAEYKVTTQPLFTADRLEAQDKRIAELEQTMAKIAEASSEVFIRALAGEVG